MVARPQNPAHRPSSRAKGKAWAPRTEPTRVDTAMPIAARIIGRARRLDSCWKAPKPTDRAPPAATIPPAGCPSAIPAARLRAMAGRQISAVPGPALVQRSGEPRRAKAKGGLGAEAAEGRAAPVARRLGSTTRAAGWGVAATGASGIAALAWVSAPEVWANGEFGACNVRRSPMRGSTRGTAPRFGALNGQCSA